MRLVRLIRIIIRVANGPKGGRKIAVQNLYGRKPNTVTSNVVQRNKNVSETESKLTFSPERENECEKPEEKEATNEKMQNRRNRLFLKK